MTRELFIEKIESFGFQKDHFGHWQKTFVLKIDANTEKVKTYRWKVSKILARKEIKALIGGKNEWVRIKSEYMSKLSINPETGKITGFSLDRF